MGPEARKTGADQTKQKVCFDRERSGGSGRENDRRGQADQCPSRSRPVRSLPAPSFFPTPSSTQIHPTQSCELEYNIQPPTTAPLKDLVVPLAERTLALVRALIPEPLPVALERRDALSVVLQMCHRERVESALTNGRGLV
jgi:hypothetical protein